MDTMLTTVREFLASHSPSLVAAGLILVAGWLGARLCAAVARRATLRATEQPTLAAFVGRMVSMGVIALAVIAALARLGVNTTSMAAVLAAAGLAVGLALQGSLANFAAGVMIMIFRPFSVGDLVEAGGVMGTVEEVQVFATTLRTGHNRAIIVGNAAMTSGSITNYSAKDTRRVDMVFGIGYSDDIGQAKAVLTRVLAEGARVLAEPEPTIGVVELADSSVNFVVLPWVKRDDYWGVYFDTHERVKLAFDAEGLSIPFPQQDVHMHTAA
jgi:small conductance mechanosensitive channel